MTEFEIAAVGFVGGFLFKAILVGVERRRVVETQLNELELKAKIKAAEEREVREKYTQRVLQLQHCPRCNADTSPGFVGHCIQCKVTEKELVDREMRFGMSMHRMATESRRLGMFELAQHYEEAALRGPGPRGTTGKWPRGCFEECAQQLDIYDEEFVRKQGYW